MPYIDIIFYQEFSGDMNTSEEELDLIISRASDMIDFIAQYRIGTLENHNESVQKQIKKATAAQTLYMVENGGIQAFNEGVSPNGGVRIGEFSYNDSGKKDGAYDTRFPQSVIDYLLPTGLLYAGL